MTAPENCSEVTSLDIGRCNAARGNIKAVAAQVQALRDGGGFSYGGQGMPTREMAGEAMANVTLAYRHLQDADARLGRAIDALIGA
jgi:hypothetical protein